MNAFSIAPIAEEHIDGFWECFDAVARERLFLARLQAPPREQTHEFLLNSIRTKAPAFVAIAGGVVVGWCDVVVNPRETMTHSGTLGMGVRSAHRGMGIGTALMQAVLAAARERGITRVELTVRVDNTRAKGLYDRAGFKVEGLCRDHMRIDGKCYDSYLMAILLA